MERTTHIQKDGVTSERYQLPTLASDIRVPGSDDATTPDEPVLHRRLQTLRSLAAQLRHSKLTPLQLCRAILANRFANAKVHSFFSALPAEERHYWIASLYALRMPKARRRELSAYFTPPHLARHALDQLRAAGVVFGRARILDPACGGAAFLVPLAARIIHEQRAQGARPTAVLRAVESSLAGIEIEADLGALARSLVIDLLGPEIKAAQRMPFLTIRTADSLTADAPEPLYDAIICNPPYGRVFRPAPKTLRKFDAVITNGYVNLYALFVELALRWTKPGGVMCLIVPISFIGGPHFAALRKRILETAHVLRLDPIDKRSDVFLDVLYDVCVLLLRKRGGKAASSEPTSYLLQIDEPPQLLGRLQLPAQPSTDIWVLPDGSGDTDFFAAGLVTLADYGYIARTGYFVWNREQDRYRTGYTRKGTEVPLYWAHNVRPNACCFPSDSVDDRARIGFVKIGFDEPSVIKTDAVLLQRTSNRRQKRRLIAGLVRQSSVPGGNGFVTENHTILLLPDPSKAQAVPLATLCKLLNTSAVDARFRRISGSVSVSTKALRSLPLPQPAILKTCFGATRLSDDEAAAKAYALSLERASEPTKEGAQ